MLLLRSGNAPDGNKFPKDWPFGRLATDELQCQGLGWRVRLLLGHGIALHSSQQGLLLANICQELTTKIKCWLVKQWINRAYSSLRSVELVRSADNCWIKDRSTACGNGKGNVLKSDWACTRLQTNKTIPRSATDRARWKASEKRRSSIICFNWLWSISVGFGWDKVGVTAREVAWAACCCIKLTYN